MNDSVIGRVADLVAASWLPQVLAVILGIVAINLGAWYLLRRLERLAARSAALWDDALIKAARRPLTLILWIAATAIELGAPLVTRDRAHFERITGLTTLTY